MKILGTVRIKSTVQTFDGTEFKKVDLVVQEPNGTPYKLEFQNNNIDLLTEDVLIGKDVVVYYNIRGKFYDKKDENGQIIGKECSNSFVAYSITVL